MKLSANELLFARNVSLTLVLLDILCSIWATHHYDNLLFVTLGVAGLVPSIILICALAELWPRVYFQEQIGMCPPKRGDWEATKVAREVAGNKKHQLQKYQDWLIEEESTISSLLGSATHEQVIGLLKRVKDVRHKISSAKRSLKIFNSVMERFSCNV